MENVTFSHILSLTLGYDSEFHGGTVCWLIFCIVCLYCQVGVLMTQKISPNNGRGNSFAEFRRAVLSQIEAAGQGPPAGPRQH